MWAKIGAHELVESSVTSKQGWAAANANGCVAVDDSAADADAICRICLQGCGDEAVEEGDPFLAPCNCKGSLRWVHRNCLQAWQRSAARLHRTRALRCGICGAPFKCGILDEQRHFCASEFLLGVCGDVAPGTAGTLTLTALLVAALVVLLGLLTDLTNVDAAQVPGLGAGVFLVSTESIRSGIFHRSVVLLVDHSRWGARGFIVNKPSSAKRWQSTHLSAEAVDDSEESAAVTGWEGAGGPVLQNTYVAHVCNSDETCRSSCPSCKHAQQVLDGVWWSEEYEELNVANVSQHHMRLHGYAGWAPRQLEMEIARKAWKLVNATQEFVFSEDSKDLWKKLTEVAASKEVASV